MTDTRSSPGTDEPHAEIVRRLQINWDNHSEKIGEALMRLIACLGSCENVNLSGIDRDLIVYAMAHTRCAAQGPTAPPPANGLPTLDEYRNNLVEECARVAEAQAQEFLSPEYATEQPFGSFCERFACAEVAKAIRALAIPSTHSEAGK